MRVLVLAAMLLACAIVLFGAPAHTVSAQPVCNVPSAQVIRGGTHVDLPAPHERSLLPLEYAGKTLRIYLPDAGDFGVRMVILGSGLPTVEVCFVEGEAFVVLSLSTGQALARSANTVHGRQVIDTIILTKRLQDTFYEETPTPTPTPTRTPTRVPTPVNTPQIQGFSPSTADVAGVSTIRPPSTGSAGLRVQ